MKRTKSIWKSHIICVFILMFVSTGCSAQKQIKEKNQTEQEVSQLKKEIETLTNNNIVLKKQIDTSLTIYQNSNSSISNNLETMSIIIAISAFGLGIIGFILGLYINRKEKSIKEILDKAEVYLKDQKLIQKDIESDISDSLKQTKDLKESVNNNLKSLYIKLKDEELNEIIENIDENPPTIHNHISRLISLNIDNKYYDLFISRLFYWHNEGKDSGAISDLLIFLLGRFPNKLLENQAIRPIINIYWSRITRHLPFETIKITLHNYMDNYLIDAYAGIEDEAKAITKAVSSDYNQQYIAKELLFNQYEEKEKRFKLYKFLKENEIGMVFHIYKYLLRSEYQDSENTESQQAIIDEIE